MGGGSGGGKQKTTTEPWKEQRPHLQYGFRQARDIYDQGAPDYFPGSTVAEQSPYTQLGIASGFARGLGGSSLIDQAQSGLEQLASGQNLYSDPAMGRFTQLMSQNPSQAEQLMNQTASGQFLGANPHLDDVYNRAAGQLTNTFNQDILPGIDAGAIASGRFGSGAQAGLRARAASDLTQNLGGLATDIYAGDYARERGMMESAQQAMSGAGLGRGAQELGAAQALSGAFGGARGDQVRAAGLAPGLAEMDYRDIASMQQSGAMQDAYGQQRIDADIDRYNYEQLAQQNWLGNYMNMIQGAYGGTTTAPGTGANKMMGGLGGAASGAAMGTAIMPGWGTAVGAGVGGLLGMFG